MKYQLPSVSNLFRCIKISLPIITCIIVLFIMRNLSVTHTKPVPLPKSPWENISKSNDITAYAAYFKRNPKTEHINELKKLINNFLINKINQEKKGKELIKNPPTIPVPVADLPFGFRIGDSITLDRGYHAIMRMQWYSDPTNPLSLRMEENRVKYLSGKGIGIKGNKMYTFGF